MTMKTRFLTVIVMLTASLTASAADTWTTPFRGGRLLHRVTSSQDAWVLQVDLCEGGIDVRATDNALKGRTVSSFANAVGAVAAVNGDFFSPSFSTDGPAMGSGGSWGAGRDHTYVTPISFGPNMVDIPHHDNEIGPAAGARDVVSGHPTLLDDTAVVGNPGDPLCTNRHPRTAIGVSADKRSLILAVVDGRRSGAAGMTCPELAALMAEHGAFDAVNMDGGGSSTMFVSGAVKNRPSDGQQRTVGNHLAIMQRGGDDTPLCPERAPVGVLDSASCDDGVVGWAIDVDRTNAPVSIHVYVGGPAGSGAPGFVTSADQHREDLCAFLGCERGFAWPLPARFKDNTPRDVFAYAIDAPGASGRQLGNPLLQGGPKSVTCAPPALPATPQPQRRHITSADSLGAWRLSFDDVSVQASAAVVDVAAGAALPEAPRLARTSDDPRVYVVDDVGGHAIRRHVADLTSFAAWRFEADDIVVVDDIIATTAEGPAWPAAPFLFREGQDPAVFVLDTAIALPSDDDADEPSDSNDEETPSPPGDEDPATPDVEDRTEPRSRTIEVAPTAACAAGAPSPTLLWALFIAALFGSRRRSAAPAVDQHKPRARSA